MIYFGISSTFFLNTWEEYYVGELILPIVHGVSEGTLLIDILCFISGIKGVNFFLQKSEWFKIRYVDVLCLVVVVGGMMFGFKSILGVIKKIQKNKVKNALKDTLIYVIFFFVLLSIGVLNDSVIVKNYPKFLFLTFGFEFAKLMGILQLSHVLGAPYNPYKPVFLIPLFVLLIHNLVYYFSGVKLLFHIFVLGF